MELNANYHDCKIEVKAIIPGSLSSFIYAYCKTVNCPDQLEPYFIRKSISIAKLAKHVRENITNDFDGWYRANEDSQTLFDVIAGMINAAEDRKETYGQPKPKEKLVSDPFFFPGCSIPFVLVSK